MIVTFMSTAQQDKKIVRVILFPLTCPELGYSISVDIKKTKFRIVTANIRNSKKTLVRFSIRVIHYSSSGFNQLQKIKRKPSQITSNFIAINNNNNTKSSLIQVLRTCNTLIRYLSSRYNQSLL
jgi:hypothetical protein